MEEARARAAAIDADARQISSAAATRAGTAVGAGGEIDAIVGQPSHPYDTLRAKPDISASPTPRATILCLTPAVRPAAYGISYGYGE